MTEHVDTVRTYVVVWITLLFLTGITSAVAFLDMGALNFPVAMAIAMIKMLLVALFFMHVRRSTKLTRFVVVGGMLWLGILLTLSMADFASRGWLSVPGK